uniref:Uncharacterized protein n=1 Tax=Vombatus ursinus TaxID=29139 RepID=A0A4X2M9R9_VOMUR
MDTGVIVGELNVILTIGLLIHGKEVGNNIGEKRELVKRIMNLSASQKGIDLRK